MIFGKMIEVPRRARPAREQIRRPEKRRESDHIAEVSGGAADLDHRLCAIERRLEELSEGQSELRRTMIGQERRGAVSASNILAYYGRDFIDACYVHLLGRLPDEAAVWAREAQLKKGASRQSILIDVYRSREARSLGVRVKGIKFLLLRERMSPRSGTSGGYSRRERTLLPIERLLRSGSADFLVHCYREILGRQPDRQGLAHYSERLAHCMARTRVIGDLVYSEEGKRRRVTVPGLWWRYPLAGIFSGRARALRSS